MLRLENIKLHLVAAVGQHAQTPSPYCTKNLFV